MASSAKMEDAFFLPIWNMASLVVFGMCGTPCRGARGHVIIQNLTWRNINFMHAPWIHSMFIPQPFQKKTFQKKTIDQAHHHRSPTLDVAVRTSTFYFSCIAPQMSFGLSHTLSR